MIRIRRIFAFGEPPPGKLYIRRVRENGKLVKAAFLLTEVYARRKGPAVMYEVTRADCWL